MVRYTRNIRSSVVRSSTSRGKVFVWIQHSFGGHEDWAVDSSGVCGSVRALVPVSVADGRPVHDEDEEDGAGEPVHPQVVDGVGEEVYDGRGGRRDGARGGVVVGGNRRPAGGLFRRPRFGIAFGFGSGFGFVFGFGVDLGLGLDFAVGWWW